MVAGWVGYIVNHRAEYLAQLSRVPWCAATRLPQVAPYHWPMAANPEEWHQRLGHASYASLSCMQWKGMVEGVGVSAEQFAAAGREPGVCGGCAAGKQHKQVALALPSNATCNNTTAAVAHRCVCAINSARQRCQPIL
ncbi:integrase catalytic domain-containing protein, partial [Haematococcus lacustris]